MELFNEAGTIVHDNPQEREWGNRLIALFNEMVQAGCAPHDTAYYFCDIATAMRCEWSVKITFQIKDGKGLRYRPYGKDTAEPDKSVYILEYDGGNTPRVLKFASYTEADHYTGCSAEGEGPIEEAGEWYSNGSKWWDFTCWKGKLDIIEIKK